MIIRVSHRLDVSMILQTISRLLEPHNVEPTKRAILSKLRVDLAEFGVSHFHYWGDDEGLHLYSLNNKEVIKNIFLKHWEVKSLKIIDKFFEVNGD